MRTVIMPSVYNPYNLYYCVQNFKKKWYNAVDRMYVSLEGDLLYHIYLKNDLFSHNFERVKELCLEICDDPKIKVITKDTPDIRFFPGKTPEDPRSKAFVKLVSCCEGDTILMSHDDFIFLDDRYIQEWFTDVESGKIDYVYFVGVNSPPLHAAMSKQYDVSFLKYNVPDWMKGENYCPFGMTSYGFVSNLKLLLQSEGDFGDRYCKIGEVIPELKWESTMDFNIDYLHLTPLKWHSKGYRKVKSPGDGICADFYNRKNAPYAYLTIDDFCKYDYPYFHVCLGSFFFGNLIMQPEKFKNELSVTYTSNPSSAEIMERFLYFNTGYVNLFPEEFIEKYKLKEFHNAVKNNCSVIQTAASEHYKSLGWKFNTFEHFGDAPLKRYI